MGSRARAAVAVAVLTVGAGFAIESTAAAKKLGRVEVQKRVTLDVSVPGTFSGTVSVKKPKITASAAAGGEVASNRDARKAKRKASRVCKRHAARTQVRVFHEPDAAPRTLIGSAVPSGGTWSVTAPAVPSEDLVSAVQARGGKMVRAGAFRWKVICLRAADVQLVP